MAKTVLIVDDEPLVRSLLRKLLSRSGFEIIEGTDGPLALLKVRELGGNVAALVTDFDMPKMSGVQLAKAVQAEFPTIPILFLSGTHELADEIKASVPGSTLIQKPFEPSIVIEALRKLISSA